MGRKRKSISKQKSPIESEPTVEEVKPKVKPTPREQAEDITNEVIEPHHIGKMSKKVLIQEYFSLINIKPLFRNSKWQKRFSDVNGELKKLPSDVRSDIKAKALKMKTVGVRE